MTIVYACIAPHGGELIPRLAGKSAELFRPTRQGIRRLARELEASRPETLVVFSSHNLRLHKHVAVVVSEHTAGSVEEGGASVRLRSKCDTELAWGIVSEAEKRGLPVVAANYGTSSGKLSCMQMDWGTLVPLWFFAGRGRKARNVVIATPSREIPLEQNLEFGAVVGEVSEKSGRRVAVVASADQAHAHSRRGPYGYSDDARRYDEEVIEIVKSGDLSSLLKINTGVVEGAKPDSLWQMVMLAGVLKAVKMSGEIVSYQVPTYYGMLCAGYRRV
jgi:aromatic ring-opening dioxygenase LigB subunit